MLGGWGNCSLRSPSALLPLSLLVVCIATVYSEVQLDVFDESLELQLVPFTSAPRLSLARFEFTIGANLSSSFRAGEFDLFPKPIGKLLNSHRSLKAFEVALSRGRWREEWGPTPRDFRPPGAVLTAAIETSTSGEADQVWRFLTSALSGTLCASLEGMDKEHDSSAWVFPLEMPWTSGKQRLRFSSLPYEPVCTENLTPWLKLLPCGRRRGLAALLRPLVIAESPLSSMSLAVVVNEDEGRVQLRAALDMVIPLKQRGRGLEPWLGMTQMQHCEASSSFNVLLFSKAMPAEADILVANQTRPMVMKLPHEAGVLLQYSGDVFADLDAPWQLPRNTDGGTRPWVAVQHGMLRPRDDGLAVMRDILSQEGKSERTHGRYLLRFRNVGRTRRRVRFMDQLPFFIRPLWHTFRTTFRDESGLERALEGMLATEALALQFSPYAGQRTPTELFLEADVQPGETISVFMSVQKKFIPLREFSYACEKGFDIGSAAWWELDMDEAKLSHQQVGVPEVAGLQQVLNSTFDDFIASLRPLRSSMHSSAPETRWELHFTEGLLVLLPMPDFSMPFNVIALTSTALTFFFGAMFRVTATGHLRHWVLKKETKLSTGAAMRRQLPIALLLIAAYGLTLVEELQLVQIRDAMPPALGPLVDSAIWLRAVLLGEISSGDGH